jgi:hypothetical protein
VVTFGPGGHVPGWAYAGLTGATLLALLAAGGSSRLGSRTPFLLSLVTAAVAVALLVGRGSSIA